MLETKQGIRNWLRSNGHGLPFLVLQRIVWGIVLLWAISALLFVGTEMLPGDVATAMLGQQATPKAVQAIRDELGLDRPALVRYGEWLGGVARGDLGRSYSNRLDIAKSVAPRLGNTVYLALMSALVAVPIALMLGLLCARYAGTVFDRAVGLLTLGFVSVPEFFVAYLLIALFSVTWEVLPSAPTLSSSAGTAERLLSMALPCFTLAAAVMGHMVHMTRAALLNVMNSAYIETAQLKGLSRWCITWKHALPNAAAPIINIVILNLAYLVVGVVVVEVIFVYPGMGQYMVDHVAKRDVPVVQACGLIFAAVYIGLNLLADIAVILLNPRLRHPR
jgi:peptide/nickel transport system permease protein